MPANQRRDRCHGHAGDTSPADLAGQAVGSVEVVGGEELRPADGIGVAVLPVHQVLLHDRPEVRIVQPPLVQPVEQRGKPADRHGQQPAARPQRLPGLGQGLPALRRLGQVVQRPD